MLVQKASLIYFHRAISVLTEENEKMMVRNWMSTMIQASRDLSTIIEATLWKELNSIFELANKDRIQDNVLQVKKSEDVCDLEPEQYHAAFVQEAENISPLNFSTPTKLLTYVVSEMILVTDTIVNQNSKELLTLDDFLNYWTRLGSF